MMTINSVAKAIAEKIAKEGTQFVDFNMKQGGVVSVEPWFNGSYNVYFADYGQNCSVKTIEDVAEIMINYPAKAEELQNAENEWLAKAIPSLQKMFRENFEGKTWEQIRNDEYLYELWGSYSDFHKDCYGYRPHDVVCGVYVNPNA